MASIDILETSNKYPLAAYEGAQPAAPIWFRDAVASEYVTHSVKVDGANVAYQQWGQSDKPGLLLVHGNGAHAHWYDFIAPSFSDEFNVIAMTFTGMGDSDWRDAYSLDQFSAEQMAVMQDAGLFENKIKPVIAAHSFGGVISAETAVRFGHKFTGLVTMDTPFFPPEQSDKPSTPQPRTKNIFFPDQSAALSRFRLLPPQPCENHYILDYVARHSLKPMDRDGRQGWAWKFDPTLWEKVSGLDLAQWDRLPSIKCQLAFMRGEQSVLVTDKVKDNMLKQVAVPFASVPHAHHHLFLDNPLGTIEKLKSIFSNWTMVEN